MENAKHCFSPVHKLARRLQQDIESRNLVIGDRYLTADEAATMLGVSRTMAHRAMKILADSHHLSRHRSLGTFVGPGPSAAVPKTVRTVHFLITQRDRRAAYLNECWGEIIDGIAKSVDNTTVSISFLPAGQEVAFVEQLVAQGRSIGQIAGVIAVSCPREVYRYLFQSGIPTLVHGSLYDNEVDLPTVDRDNKETGRLAARFLIEQGCRRLAILTMVNGRPGDHDFFDGVAQAMTEGQLPPKALMLRVMPEETAVAISGIRDLFEQRERPEGVIIRGVSVLAAAMQVAGDAGLCVGEDIEFVYEEFIHRKDGSPADRQNPLLSDPRQWLPSVRTRHSVSEIAATLGSMLKRIAGDEPLKERRVILPVELHCPVHLGSSSGK